MRIAIVDDIESDRKKLTDVTNKYFSEACGKAITIDEFDDSNELMKAFSVGLYDVVFLGICMDGMNGIEAAREIRKTDKTVKLVFVTRSNNFASESYSVGANGYILKPYTEDIYYTAIDSLGMSCISVPSKLELPDGRSILLGSIVYTSFLGHYVTIYQADGNIVRVRITQEAFSKLLLMNRGFVSCNRGMIVNLREVNKIELDKFVLKNGTYIPISRRRFAEVKRAYLEFLNEQQSMG